MEAEGREETLRATTTAEMRWSKTSSGLRLAAEAVAQIEIHWTPPSVVRLSGGGADVLLGRTTKWPRSVLPSLLPQKAVWAISSMQRTATTDFGIQTMS